MSATRLARGALKIPSRIPRGPTDLLKALSSTVKYIPTEPDPILCDDKQLLPRRSREKQIMILSKLSGYKTAQFFLNKHPELFYRDDAEPKIKAFLPPEDYRDDMEFTEEDLQWCITNKDPVNGAIAYKSMREKGTSLTDECLMDFFELLCYTNEDSHQDLWDLMRQQLVIDSNASLSNQTWQKNCLADEIFDKVKGGKDPSRAYSIMIAGLSKHGGQNLALDLFLEFDQKYTDQGLYTVAYSSLLSAIVKAKSSTKTGYETLNHVLTHMTAHEIKPDLMVFNNILKVYQSYECDSRTCQKALMLMNEMRALNIEPSLASYMWLFRTLCRFKSGRSNLNLFDEVLQYIHKNPSLLQVRDAEDVNFLRDSMRIFASNMNNLTLATNLHKIYMLNPNLFSSSQSKNLYLGDLFKLIITADSLDNIMKFYNDHSMHMDAHHTLYEHLVEALDLYQAPREFIQQVGLDIVKSKKLDKIRNMDLLMKDPVIAKAADDMITSNKPLSK